jgi:hypothetical protein
MYILVDALLYIFGSCRVIKKQSRLTPTWDFLQLSGNEKAFFFASMYSKIITCAQIKVPRGRIICATNKIL